MALTGAAGALGWRGWHRCGGSGAGGPCFACRLARLPLRQRKDDRALLGRAAAAGQIQEHAALGAPPLAVLGQQAVALLDLLGFAQQVVNGGRAEHQEAALELLEHVERGFAQLLCQRPRGR